MTDAKYSEQLGAMMVNARRWFRENADAQPMVQFNFSAGVAVIAPISSAVEVGLVSTNEDGLKLIQALGRWGNKAIEPTVPMVRAVVEAAMEDEVKTRERFKTHKIINICSHCGLENNAATSTQGGSPGPGAITICIGCFGVSEWYADEGGKLKTKKCDVDALPDEVKQHLAKITSSLKGVVADGRIKRFNH